MARSEIREGETLPFRALLRRNDDEAWEEAMAVVDCSGTYAPETAQRSGSGGLSAPGEAKAEALGLVSRVIPSPGSFKGKRVAVLGGGFSAITTIRKLADEGVETGLARAQGHEAPYQRVDADPLPQRDALAAYGNGLASLGTSGSLELYQRRPHPENRRRAERPQADSDRRDGGRGGPPRLADRL